MANERSAESLLVSIGGRIRDLRLDADLTVEQLAERAGRSRRYIESAERGLASLDVGALEAIARGVGVAPMVLLVDPEAGPLDALVEHMRTMTPEQLADVRDRMRAPRSGTGRRGE